MQIYGKVRVEANEEPGFSDPGIPVVPFIGLEAAREQGTVNEKRATETGACMAPVSVTLKCCDGYTKNQ